MIKSRSIIKVDLFFRIQRMKKVRHQVMHPMQVTQNAIWKHCEPRNDFQTLLLFSVTATTLKIQNFQEWFSKIVKKALKTQVLKEKTQIIKRKGLSPKKGNDVPPPKIMKKEVSIQRRLGERIQLQTSTDNGPRRVIKSKRFSQLHTIRCHQETFLKVLDQQYF